MEKFLCEPFGTVTVRRRAGARSIRIRIEADSLSVSADPYTSIKDIIRLLEDNEDKILEKQMSQKSRQQFVTDNFEIKNRYFSLSVQKDDKLRKHLLALETERGSMPYRFTLKCSTDVDFSDSATQEVLLKAINQTIRRVAQKPLEERTMQLAAQLGLEVNAVRTKLEKSKWGSCSSRKNINLSAYLILLPERLTDFVIIHELCHLREMNHSPRFHALVNQYTGGREKELDRELKRHSINIFDYTTQADV